MFLLVAGFLGLAFVCVCWCCVVLLCCGSWCLLCFVVIMCACFLSLSLFLVVLRVFRCCCGVCVCACFVAVVFVLVWLRLCFGVVREFRVVVFRLSLLCLWCGLLRWVSFCCISFVLCVVSYLVLYGVVLLC